MTRRRLPPEKLPDWPRFMTRDLAAAYTGVTEATFCEELKSGWWPDAIKRGPNGGILTWDRLALDLASDRLSKLTAGTPNGPTEGETEVRRRMRGKSKEQRPEAHRSQA